ncbi:unnamed protein product [Chironomus riparius]|uniref:Uncharacterized protein n=1 Tax=Chironomus riparius TaxID=315576 RepID=A0A9N9WNI9_9DIPT|nr:unnamed protein product [Chironomus riparius]
MFLHILILLLSMNNSLLAYPSDFVFPDSLNNLDFKRRVSSGMYTSIAPAAIITEYSTTNPLTTEESQDELEKSTKIFQEIINTTEIPSSTTNELFEISNRTLIDSRNVFDTPCVAGYRRDRNNICRKVYKK